MTNHNNDAIDEKTKPIGSIWNDNPTFGNTSINSKLKEFPSKKDKTNEKLKKTTTSDENIEKNSFPKIKRWKREMQKAQRKGTAITIKNIWNAMEFSAKRKKLFGSTSFLIHQKSNCSAAIFA